MVVYADGHLSISVFVKCVSYVQLRRYLSVSKQIPLYAAFNMQYLHNISLNGSHVFLQYVDVYPTIIRYTRDIPVTGVILSLQALQRAGHIISEIRETHMW
jgi:hypothetical protein